MANMSNREFQDAERYIQDNFRYGNGSVDDYVSYLKRIISSYSDGYDCAKRLDRWNSKWTVFGKYL